MSKIKIEKAYTKKRITSFGGIREGLSKSGEGASDIRNLRIMPNGSLEKRNGWYAWKMFSDPIRGFWQGTVDEEYYIFIVSGNTVYRVSEEESAVTVGTLSSSTGRVRFQRYRDRLYLFDGVSIHRFHSQRKVFDVARGYVPLFGENWHPTKLGNIHEPANLLNRNLRIHYLNTTGTTTFSLPFFTASIDSMRVNNKVTTKYSFSAGSDQFTLSSASAGDVVEVAITVSGGDAMQQQLHGVTNSFLHREGTREDLFLYGSPQGYRVFCSSEVTDLMLSFCAVYYSDCDPLYFKSTQTLLIGDADHPVTAMTANFDRILAFHTGGAHSISVDGDTIYSYPVLSDIGCSTKDAAIQIGNDAIVANERGICRLHATSSDPDSFSIKNLSENLGEKWSRKICKNASLFWDSTRQELWVRDTSETAEGIVWIWNEALNEWYCFDNIYATFFDIYKGQIIFGDTKSQMCLFDEAIYTDDEQTFSAYYQSNYMNFDSVHTAKRSLRTSVSLNTNGNDLLIAFDTERDFHIFAFEGKASSAPEFFNVRLSPGRFRFLSYRITCIGTHASNIYEANFFTTR